jgi:hypothetical protein
MADVTLQQFLWQLTEAQSRSVAAVDGVVAKGALNIKKDAAKRISGHPHLPAYPRSITYDLYHLPFQARADIGPDKSKRQGAMGNIIEYGTVNNAPLPHLRPALDAEAPRFADSLMALGEQLLS